MPEDPNRPLLVREHESWVRSRMQLDAELMEWIRHGLSSIGIGFGSFAFLQGVVGGAGEAERSASPSRAFSLVATVVGIAMVLLAADHARRMIDWVNRDEFGGAEAPELPNERRPFVVAAAVVAIGAVSFVGLLLLR
jgi:uncharacterized membrane protein YidH (DUF202 family)